MSPDSIPTGMLQAIEKALGTCVNVCKAVVAWVVVDVLHLGQLHTRVSAALKS